MGHAFSAANGRGVVNFQVGNGEIHPEYRAPDGAELHGWLSLPVG